ncbi:hypothetical protein EMIT0P176_60020 [Pseudomonas sp. IT-P176]
MPRTPWPLPFAMPIPAPACCPMGWGRRAVVAVACACDLIASTHEILLVERFAPGLSATSLTLLFERLIWLTLKDLKRDWTFARHLG